MIATGLTDERNMDMADRKNMNDIHDNADDEMNDKARSTDFLGGLVGTEGVPRAGEDKAESKRKGEQSLYPEGNTIFDANKRESEHSDDQADEDDQAQSGRSQR
jgi:hypothetical protein